VEKSWAHEVLGLEQRSSFASQAGVIQTALWTAAKAAT
jgi:hypothetical protein